MIHLRMRLTDSIIETKLSADPAGLTRMYLSGYLIIHIL